MSGENTIGVHRLPNGQLMRVMPDGSTRPMEKKSSDWERVRNMTEEEVTANALSGPDNPPLTDEELARMHLIPNPTKIRDGLRMTPLELADAFEISLETLLEWEQRFPLLTYTVIMLLRVIEQDPCGVQAALEKSYQTIK